MTLNPESNYFEKELKRHNDNLFITVTNSYVKGSVDVSAKLNKQPPTPSRKKLNNLTKNVADLIKGVTDELSKKIRLVIRNGIIEGKTHAEMAKDLDNIFKGDNPTRFRYENRLKMIARTESTKALNTGAYDTAKKFGAKRKYINIVDDSRTSDVSKAMFKKYGSEDKAIALDEEFSVLVNGKTYSGQYPPFMPNDRDFVLFTFD